MRVQSFFFAGVCGSLLFAALAKSSDEDGSGVFARHPSASPTGDQIVFEADFDAPEQMSLWIASLDGRSLHKLTTACDGARNPTWSPDGTVIAFVCAQEVMSVNPDGSHLRHLTHGSDPNWSPDSTEIVFVDGADIWVMKAAGTDRRRVTSTTQLAKPQRPNAQPFYADHPSFSPAENKIVFSLNEPGVAASLWLVNRDGSDAHSLTSGHYQDWSPYWSWFGIVFSSNRDLSGHFKLWLVQADGKGLHKLDDVIALDPVWLSSGLVAFGNEMIDATGSEIVVLDPRTGLKRSITHAHRDQVATDATSGKGLLDRKNSAFGNLNKPKNVSDEQNISVEPPDTGLQTKYLACGCGCCGGEPVKDQCLYRTHGQTLEEIQKQDQALKHSALCELAGCSVGVRYHYCD